MEGTVEKKKKKIAMCIFKRVEIHICTEASATISLSLCALILLKPLDFKAQFSPLR